MFDCRALDEGYVTFDIMHNCSWSCGIQQQLVAYNDVTCNGI